ncbi:hypothetical protein [Tahibacter caeni]|uniref:hypothetical protein n=1 Tax=Tahibacter caeni TaxID=1453545 RepID=UPI0021476A27|nr:hypothetical protein [Tahibacter caeni]
MVDRLRTGSGSGLAQWCDLRAEYIQAPPRVPARTDSSAVCRGDRHTLRTRPLLDSRRLADASTSRRERALWPGPAAAIFDATTQIIDGQAIFYGSCAAAALFTLAAPATHAQQWLVNSAIQNQIIETAICDSALKKHEKLPNVCAKYPKYEVGPTATSAAPATTTAASAKFTPVADDDSLQKVADGLGSTAQERQQMLQHVTADK